MIDRIRNESDIEFALVKLSERDPALIPIINSVEHVPLRLSKDGVEGLVKIVTSQLISRAAANAIWLRIENEMGEVNEENILRYPEDDLMALGLSRAKAKTFRTIAIASSKGMINFTELNIIPADKALKDLMSLKGIGRWSAEVYLMFCCGHCDFFPAGDIALRSAAGDIFHDGNRPDEKSLRLLADRWSPYKSVAARLLWSYYANTKNREILPL
ncbi:MAG: DNA-3-methyladenine glycosylase 2 family protein [Lentilitoribacter sp.]